MYELTVLGEFEAAHFIDGYVGKCQRLHGHNWTVEARVCGRELDRLGMLVDFKLLKTELNRVLDELDHRYLNELDAFSAINPTAENLARYIFEQLAASEIFKSGATRLLSIKVNESPRSAVVYTPDE